MESIGAVQDERRYDFVQNFFVLWNTEKLDGLTELYHEISEPSFVASLAVTEENLLKYAERNWSEEGIITEPYMINRMFLYALLVSPAKWSKLFAEVFETLLAAFKKEQRWDSIYLTEITEKSSYPPELLNQLHFLLKIYKKEPELERIKELTVLMPVINIAGTPFEKSMRSMKIHWQHKNTKITLCEAVKAGLKPLVEFLVTIGHDPFEKDREGKIALDYVSHLSSSSEVRQEMTKFLLLRMISDTQDIHKEVGEYGTLLHYVVRLHCPEAVKRLMSKQSNLTELFFTIDLRGKILLHYISRESYDISEEKRKLVGKLVFGQMLAQPKRLLSLLAKWPDLLRCVIDFGELSQLVDLLSQVNKFPKETHQKWLIIALEKRNVTFVEYFLNLKIYQDPNFYGSCFPAAYQNWDKRTLQNLLRFVLKKKIEFSIPKNPWISSPVLLAAQIGDPEIMKLLVEKKKWNINEKTFTAKSTALHNIAAEKGWEDVVRVILDNNADITLRNNIGRTAFHCAVRKGAFGVVNLFLRHSVDINVCDKYGDSPLSSAFLESDYEISECLLVYCMQQFQEIPNPNEKDFKVFVKKMSYGDKKRTVLHEIAKKGDTEQLKKMLSLMKNSKASFDFFLNAQDASKNTALHLAVKSGNIEVVEILLKQPGLKVNLWNKAKKSALHIACKQRDEAMVACLLK